MKHSGVSFRSIYLLVALFFVGCGGGGSSSGTSPASVITAPSVQTGTVRIQSVLARSVPTAVTHFRATGFDSRGAVRFGPQTVTKANTVEFVLPTTVVTLQMEYLANGALLGLGSTPVTVVAGQTTELTNLDFQDVSAALDRLNITPGNSSLAAGTSVNFRAEGTFADLTQRDLTSSVTWSSSSPGVATVVLGRVTGVAPGTATITATLGTVSQQITITVTQATLTSIAVSPSPLNLGRGTTSQLTATGTFSDGTQQDVTATVTWSSSAPATASVSPTGLANALQVGQANITATSGSVSGSTAVVVTNATLTQIVVTPAMPTLAAGTNIQLTATGTFSDGSTQNLTTSVSWSSNQTGIANVGPTGLLTAVATGTTNITASLGGVSGSTSANVTAPILTSVTVTPVNPSVPAGNNVQFQAFARFSDGSQQDVTASAAWTSSQTAQATINTSGLATGVAPGQSTITANFNGQSGSTTLTVTAATLTSIAVTPPTSNLALGTSVQLQAIANFSDGTQQDITSSVAWSSANGAASVSPGGLVRALSAGGSQITASFQGRSGGASVTVTPATIISVEVTPSTAVLAAGTNQQMIATATLSDGSQQIVTAGASWSSSLPASAVVNTTGLVTAIGAGQTQIQATISGVSGNTTLTVTTPSVDGLVITPNTTTIVDGLFQQLTATATFSDGTQQDVSTSAIWTSDTPNITLININGAAIGRSPGTSLITANFGGQTASATVNVTAATVTRIRVTPATPVATKGSTQAFTAIAIFSDFTQRDVTSSATWTSGTPAVASVNTSGLASALATGQSTVNARFGGVTGIATLTVTEATVDSIVVTPNSPSLAQGLRQQFTAVANLSDGTQQDITSSATWTSSDTGIATVPPGGEARGVAVGIADIRATFKGTTGTTQLNVTSAQIIRLLLGPAPLSPAIPAGASFSFFSSAAFSNGSTVNVTNSSMWSSSRPEIATINAAGLVTAVSPGQTTITVSFSGLSLSTTLTVTGPAVFLQSLVIEPPLALSAPGSQRQYRVTGTFSDSSTQDLTSQVVWSSNNAQVTLGNNNLGPNRFGLAQIGAGATTGTTATITATLGTVSGNSTLRINRFAYINQDDQTITTFATDALGVVSQVGMPVTVGTNLNPIEIDPSGRWLYAGTGTPASVLVPHTINADGSLTANGPSVPIPPFGPRAVDVHPNGEVLYVLDSGDRVLTFRIGADGRLSSFGSAVSDPSATGNADLAVHPNGRFLYVASTASNTLSVYSIANDGSLSLLVNYPSGDRFSQALHR